MGLFDEVFSRKKKVSVPIPPNQDNIEPMMTKPAEEDYKKKYDELRQQVKQTQEKPVEKPVEEEKKETTQAAKDIEWFYENYGQTFQAQQTPVNNETVMINLLFGCLMELKKLNEKAQ